MPLTALKHYEELAAIINSLKKNPERFAVRFNPSWQEYGINIRGVDYKKMAIVYSIEDKTVYIYRILPSSLIK